MARALGGGPQHAGEGGLAGRIVLATADGASVKAICRATGKSKPCVWRWQERFADDGVDGLLRDKTRPPGSKPLAPRSKAKVLAKTATRDAARRHALERAHDGQGDGHQPHERAAHLGARPASSRTSRARFKVSNDPQFEEKVTDIVGLYMNPPDKALVLCVDEKSQIQALDRTQPGLPLKKGRAATMTHDYKRHGTTTLFAALDVKTGVVIGDCLPRHRAREFIAFLRRIDRTVAKHLDVHVVLDNYSTHKTDEVKAWLAKHPRFKLHFTPTSASWLNLVERFFAEITSKRIRRGVFTSVAELEAAIHDYLQHHNADPKPFVWTKTAEVILNKNAAPSTRSTPSNREPSVRVGTLAVAYNAQQAIVWNGTTTRTSAWSDTQSPAPSRTAPIRERRNHGTRPLMRVHSTQLTH